jgi:AhpD family alkylhydroperoxidase
MRLGILDHGHRARARIFLWLIRRATRHPIDPVAQLALYRPGFFGDPFLALAGEVLRGPSFWTVAEREYLAVFSSQLNQCPFCVRMHTEVAGLESHGEIDARDPRSARPELLAVLPLLERVSRNPAQLTAGDVGAVRAAGVPDAAIVDALHVNMIFNCINRLANAFGFAWDSDRQVRLGAKVVHRLSYRLPRILMR